MIWNDFASFWAMGGHAAYVWGAVVGVALTMTLELAALSLRDRDLASRAAAHDSDEKDPR